MIATIQIKLIRLKKYQFLNLKITIVIIRNYHFSYVLLQKRNGNNNDNSKWNQSLIIN